MGSPGGYQVDMQLIAALGDFSWFSLSSWWAIAQVVIGLGIVIFVHELGHFLVAKACGIKCEKFYVGFDAFDIKIGDMVLIPRRLVHFQWGETEYGIGILPLGGYVKMLGQEDSPSKMAEERARAMQTSDEDADGESSADIKPTVDPRSYIAKSVPQRMAVISAGVIMNLIFAVVFGTIAFYNGVYYDPPVIGATSPGSPANQANLDGAEVVSVNGQEITDRYFTFINLREAVIFTDEGETVTLGVKRNDGTVEEVELTPTNDILKDPLLNLPAIGISVRNNAQVSAKLAAVPGQIAASAEPPIQTKDLFTRINGVDIRNGYELTREMAKNWAKPVTVTVERETENGTENVDIQIGANPMRTLGLVMKIEKIVMIQRDSPAEAAAASDGRTGLQVGDQIVAINGEPVGDVFTLEQRMIELLESGKDEVGIRVKRTNDEGKTSEIDFQISLRHPRNLPMPINGPYTIDSLGIAVLVTNEVAQIVPDSPAADSKIKVGDTILAANFFPSDEDKKELYKYYQKGSFDKIKLNTDEAAYGWPVVHHTLQALMPGTQVELTVESGDKEFETTLKVENSKKWFIPSRGIPLTQERRFYQAKSFSEAVSLGARQTWIDATRVLAFLKRLVTGKISVTSLGGPATIAVVATSEASEGTSRLLMFLVLISANLAIVNFLPIPVLDGGHMMFLAYEGITGKPPSETVQGLLSWAGLAFLLTLMLFVLGLDLFRLFFV
jgi:regulator of sigma E protease